MKRPFLMLRPRWQQLRRCGGLAMLLGCLGATGSAAQVVLDGSLGAAKHLTGPHYVVSARDGKIRGANLFHSFATLQVLTGQSLTFTGPPTIDHILSRVTGHTPSFIDGTLRATIPGANLFILNPQGVIFGPNATLDVSGSFHVSTAQAVRFADGRRFSTLRPQAQLSIAAPEAFGFLGRQAPAALTILGSALHVPAGQTVSVVGGEVKMFGNGAVSRDVPTLAAPGGRIQVVSRATPGEVDVIKNSLTEGTLGPVYIAQEALLRTSGEGGGSVVIRGGRIVVDHAVVVASTLGHTPGAATAVTITATESLSLKNGAVVTSNALGAGAAGDIRLTAPSVRVDTGAAVVTRALVGSSGASGHVIVTAERVALRHGAVLLTATGGRGRGGDLVVDVKKLTVCGGASLTTLTVAAGAGGAIQVAAREAITLAGRDADGVPSALTSAASGRGAAGSIDLTTPVLALKDGLIVTDTRGRGPGGDVHVAAAQCSLLAGARITSSASGAGRGGNVTVVATDAIRMQGRDVTGLPSGVVSVAEGRGKPGGIALTAPTVTVTGGRIGGTESLLGRTGPIAIQSNHFRLTQGGQIISGTTVAQPGGTITITATGSLSIVGQMPGGEVSGVRSTTILGQGTSGKLLLAAPVITITAGIVQAKSDGPGAAGGIVVQVGRLRLTQRALIDSSTLAEGRGGHVTITATEAISVLGHGAQGFRSGITSLSITSTQAGRLNLSAPEILLDGGIVSAGTVSGQAGQVKVQAERLTLSGGGSIDSSAPGPGVGGTVRVVVTDTLNITGKRSSINSHAETAGQVGNVFITAPTLVMAAGEIAITYGGTDVLPTTHVRPAGRLVVLAGRLILTEGARIDSSTQGASAGGNIRVLATESIVMTGHDQRGLPSRISSFTGGQGRAGQLSITTPILRLHGAVLEASTLGVGDAGDITVRADRVRITAGGGIGSASLPSATGHGGQVRIVATEALTLRGQDSQNNGSNIISLTANTGDAGDLIIAAPTIRLRGGVLSASTLGAGNAGNVTIQAKRLVVSKGGVIDNSTEISGRGGVIRITATETVRIVGHNERTDSPSAVGSSTAGRGAAGSVVMHTAHLYLDEGFIAVTTLPGSTGDAGDIRVQAERVRLVGEAIIDASTFGRGKGSQMRIVATQEIMLTRKDRHDGGSLITSLTTGPEDAGNVFLRAPRMVMDRGAIAASTGGDGAGGDISIRIGQLALGNGAQIQSNSGVDLDGTLLLGTGQGGRVHILAAHSVDIRGTESGVFTSTRGAGHGGTVRIQAPLVSLSDSAAISAASFATGNAGGIQLQVTENLSMTNSTITTEATQAAGGDIHIHTPSQLRLRQSAITATVQGGPQTVGGDVTVAADVMILQDSRISANAFAGQGGNIRLAAELLFADPLSTISASSELGIDGAVDIQAPVANLSGLISPLPQTFANVTELLSAHCAARWRAEKSSSFVLGGRDGVPAEPGALLPSPLATLGPGELLAPSAASTHSQEFLRQGRLPAATMLVDCARVRRH